MGPAGHCLGSDAQRGDQALELGSGAAAGRGRMEGDKLSLGNRRGWVRQNQGRLGVRWRQQEAREGIPVGWP